MIASRRFALVVHGARAGNPQLRHMVSWVRNRGHQVQVHVTWERGDAVRFARDASERRVDAVIAAGGDGTVNEVVNGIAERAVPLGIVPLGTANDFARQAGIPLDPDHAMDVILHRNPVRVDCGLLNDRRFLNVSTAGAGAEATAGASATAKESLGIFAYALTGARQLGRLAACEASFDSDETGPFDAPFLSAMIGNGRETGGGSVVTPRATPTDGRLDVCIVGAMPRGEFARLVLRIKRGDHLDHPRVRYFQARWLTIEPGSPLAVNADGEPLQARRLEYRCLPGELLVHVGAPGDRRW